MLTIKNFYTKTVSFLYENRGIITILFIILLCFDGNLSIYANTGVGDSLDKGASELLQEVSRVYCGSLWLLLLAIEAIIFLCSKNDKKKSAALVAGGGTIVAFVILKVLSSSGGGAIGSTAEDIAGWVE